MRDLAPPLLNMENSDDLDLCGLPKSAKDSCIEKRNIKQLYDWQKECLSDHRLLRGSNCIVSLPTGAGKTLIAEVFMLREAIVNKRSSILVLPYVAIVQEKITSLSIFEESSGIRIEEYATSKGRIPPIKRRKDVSIYVATIEKANSLINSLIESGELDRIGLVVVDELHMIGDGNRGTIIEQLLCKYLTKGFGQIIGMSATLSNIGELAGFLRAYVYSTSFRPVELHEYVRIEQTMWKVKADGDLEHNSVLPANGLAKADPDGLCQLLVGVIPQRSVLIFCPTKKNCESVATMIARCVPEEVRKRRLEDREKVLEAMKEDCEG
ncbi:DEAD/DEAH box helicase [Trichostrongylus colubriformis]|uniref:DEAD/DEAH box helicase n=1 Tax=Trichostrongylus colubriformis TaxID=6319 RepID=A0AAN8FZN5_TRICO